MVAGKPACASGDCADDRAAGKSEGWCPDLQRTTDQDSVNLSVIDYKSGGVVPISGLDPSLWVAETGLCPCNVRRAAAIMPQPPPVLPVAVPSRAAKRRSCGKP